MRYPYVAIVMVTVEMIQPVAGLNESSLSPSFLFFSPFSPLVPSIFPYKDCVMCHDN